MVDARRPIHLAVLVGASVGTYAISLAGVTALQSHTDADLADSRAPMDAATGRLGAAHDDLEAVLDQSSTTYATAAERYAALATQLERMETSLDTLGGRVTKLTGATSGLPSRISLPRVSTSAPAVRKPTVHATTGASG